MTLSTSYFLQFGVIIVFGIILLLDHMNRCIFSAVLNIAWLNPLQHIIIQQIKYKSFKSYKLKANTGFWVILLIINFKNE